MLGRDLMECQWPWPTSEGNAVATPTPMASLKRLVRWWMRRLLGAEEGMA